MSDDAGEPHGDWAAYLARVKISVKAGRTTIIREGSGAGEAIGDTPGEAHERASKAAETDATKRALSTFGNPFGLSLYAGTIDKAPKTRPKVKPQPDARRQWARAKCAPQICLR